MTGRGGVGPKRSSARPQLSQSEILAEGRRVFAQESKAIAAIGNELTAAFATAVRWMFESDGRILVTGLGKSGIVARKIAATLTSTGTPAHFVHPVEALHGDLGIATPNDILLALSRSGSNEELLVLQDSLKALGVRCIAVTGQPESALAQRSDLCLPTVIDGEACPLQLTPTTSTTAALVMGDALALALLRLRDFRAEDFAVFHPSGTLGHALRTTVEDLMHRGDQLPVVGEGAPLREALLEISGKRLGCTCVVDANGFLVGFLTDGDLKRILLKDAAPLDRPVSQSMTREPRTVEPHCLARAALRTMESNPNGPITQLVVVHDGKPLGVLHLHDILKLGLSR